MVGFPVFPAFSFIYFTQSSFCIINAPLGSTVALTASSCIPVRVQPLQACAEPPAGVSPPRRSPPCIHIYPEELLALCIIYAGLGKSVITRRRSFFFLPLTNSRKILSLPYTAVATLAID